jgi:hypothetical protein
VGYVPYHIAAVILSAYGLWLMRHELTEKATGRLGWALPPLFAMIVACILLFVSPGKRFELWTVGMIVGLVLGAAAGVILIVDKDFEKKLVRVHRTYDGVGAAGLLFILAVVRFVTSDLMGRVSSGYGVLGAIAGFLAAYLVGRIITMRYYTASRSIHLDMIKGQKPPED